MTLETVIRNIFEEADFIDDSTYTENEDSKQVYMTIPINSDNFGIPVLALSSIRSDHFPYTDVIAVKIKHNWSSSPYKSLSVALRDALYSDCGYSCRALVELKAPIGDVSRSYFCTKGAIFDADLNPILLAYWNIQRVEDGTKYKFVSPMLWVSPHVLIHRGNPMERFIVNKVIPAALSVSHIHSPLVVNDNFLLRTYEMKVKVVIDHKVPFDMREVCPPSASTTNSRLLDLALDSIDEIIT